MISIIVPIYNCEKYLVRCIESILSQTYKNIEILLIDDGSTDRSMDICKYYEMKDSRVKLFIRKNSGISATRNFGIEKASGTYIQFIDSDDYVEVNYCETFIGCMKNNKCDFVICSFNNIYEQKNKIDSIIPVVIPINGIIEIEEFMKEIHVFEYFTPLVGACWNKIYSLEMLKTQGIRFDENVNLHEDSIFVFELFRNVESIYMMNQPLYNYYHSIHHTSLTNKIHMDLYLYTNVYYEKYKTLLKEYNAYTTNQIYIESNCYDAFLTCLINIFNLKLSKKNKRLAIREIIENKIFRESLLFGRRKKLIYTFLNQAIINKKIGFLYLIIKLIYWKQRWRKI